MGNCISFTRKQDDHDDEENTRLIPETLLQAQEKALAVANERLRECNEALQISRDENVQLRETLGQAERDNGDLRREKDEQTTKLVDASKELANCRIALETKDKDISSLRERIHGIEEASRASDLVKGERIAELEKNVSDWEIESKVQGSAFEDVTHEKEELEAILSKVVCEAKLFKSETLTLAEELHWAFGGFGRKTVTRSSGVGGKESQHQALCELQQAKWTLAKEVWIMGWIGASYYNEARRLHTRLDLSTKRIEECQAELETQRNTVALLMARVAESSIQRNALTKELQEARSRRIEVPQRGSQDSLAADTSTLTYSQPHRFSQTADKDLRVSVGWWKAELRVDVREFYSGRQSRKVRSRSSLPRCGRS